MDGSSFYDDHEIFNTYMQRRQRAESPNDTLEKPVIMGWVGTFAVSVSSTSAVVMPLSGARHSSTAANVTWGWKALKIW